MIQQTRYKSAIFCPQTVDLRRCGHQEAIEKKGFPTSTEAEGVNRPQQICCVN